MVDLVPMVKRTDAIQSFVSQETPIVTITDSDGATGTGYSYTIGTGGPSVMKLIEKTLGPALIGRDAAEVERLWRDLMFLTHATTVGAITALAQAAIDTALWDLRCRKAGLPLHIMAGGAQKSVPLYTTEGGWLHLETRRAWSRTRCAPVKSSSAAPRSRSAARMCRRTWRGYRRCARRCGTGLRDHDRRQPGVQRRRGDPPGAPLTRPSTSPGSRSRSRPTTSAGMYALPRADTSRSPSAKASTARCTFASTCRQAHVRSCRWTSPASAASRPG